MRNQYLMDSAIYFVETLTLSSWFRTVWPRLMANRGKRRDEGPCYVINGTRLAVFAAKVTGLFAKVSVERLHFRHLEVRDQDGILVRSRIVYQDLAIAQAYAIEQPEFQQLLDSGRLQGRLPTFLAKNIATTPLMGSGTLLRALQVVQTCLWQARKTGYEGPEPVLFMERRPWISAITRYASDSGVTIVTVPPAPKLKVALRSWAPPKVINLLRVMRYRLLRGDLLASVKGRASAASDAWSTNGSEPPTAIDGKAGLVSTSRVATEYYGQLNLENPEFHSDLFFWQQSSLPGDNVLMTFGVHNAYLDQDKWTELKTHGIAPVVLHPGATTIPTFPVFGRHPGSNATHPVQQLSLGGSLDAKWLNQQVAGYHDFRSYWSDLFAAHNVKVFTTWYKFDGVHCAITDAMEDSGGITAVYQRSYEPSPSSENTVDVDISFVFSEKAAEAERNSKSSVRYQVVTGYLGDHRFPLLKTCAKTVRQNLEERGAKHILAFFDETSSNLSKWQNDHRSMQEDYICLLEKVLSEPWFGLVIKPKVPRTLNNRLGPVAELLARAEATGRCYVFEAHDGVQASYPPAAAALAADIAVHSHIEGATAGMEAAFAGVPTLMLDQLGWTASPLYKLGVGKVVFKSWSELWEACLQNWSSKTGTPRLGDWSPMLDELDPFRDGRAAERMGTYIHWLLEGFHKDLERDTVMADAAERYCASWGADKITESCGSLAPAAASSTGQNLPGQNSLLTSTGTDHRSGIRL